MTLALTDLTTFKVYAGITDSLSDAKITAMIPAISLAIANYCNRIFDVNTYSEVRSGSGKPRMHLVNYPIQSLIAVTICGNVQTLLADPTDTQDDGVRFIPGTRVIYINNGCFDRGEYNVVINYSAGFASVPSDLELAANMYLQFQLKQPAQAGVSSKTLGPENVTFDKAAAPYPANIRSGGMPPTVVAILAQYQNVIPETGS